MFHWIIFFSCICCVRVCFSVSLFLSQSLCNYFSCFFFIILLAMDENKNKKQNFLTQRIIFCLLRRRWRKASRKEEEKSTEIIILTITLSYFLTDGTRWDRRTKKYEKICDISLLICIEQGEQNCSTYQRTRSLLSVYFLIIRKHAVLSPWKKYYFYHFNFSYVFFSHHHHHNNSFIHSFKNKN